MLCHRSTQQARSLRTVSVWEPFLEIIFSESHQFTNRNWDHHIPKQKPRHHCRGILTCNFNSTQTLTQRLLR